MPISIVRDEPVPGGRGLTRRELLRVGGLSALGLTAGDLARLRAGADPGRESKDRPASCVFIFLFGGPSHIDLWDMKPEAPLEIRGEFKPIDTAVPGIQLCEHLPLLAQRMDKFCLLRSMTHSMPVHGPACSEIYTGRPYFGPPVTDQASPEDWPSLAALTQRYGKKRAGWPPSIVIPWFTQFAGQDKPIAGQTGGRMGEVFRPFLVNGDPSRLDFQVSGLRLPEDVPLHRALERHALLRQLESAARHAAGAAGGGESFHNHYATAFAMLGNERAAHAFELGSEPRLVRERYGESKFGQSLLLARRLVEAGISLVTVNWDDETFNDKVSPFWDTHNHNFPSLKDRLAPRFDRAFSAFLEDLHQRGLLETTLVVATGEFGRTPRIGQTVQNAMTEKTGRDHWPHAFTALLAGGGVRGGQVRGATTRTGGYIKDDPVSPADLSATILEHLGIDPTQEYWDHFQQIPRKLSTGKPLRNLG
ncbi:MAG TPA: DUF1501 domain-containing protein [Mycobacterium sp.]|nr:DUF1501 domain-containing protein [Mycobacterium sp.]